MKNDPEAGSGSGWVAYVDESEPAEPDGRLAYLLAAALLHTERTEVAREAMRSHLLPGQRKLHWHDEGHRRRMRLTQAVAGLEIVQVVVVSVDDHVTSERRRRTCLARLLRELHSQGVEHVILEARQARQNQRDRKVLDGLRAQRVLTSALRMDHLAGPADALTWIPDIVAGAVGAARGGNGAYQDELAELLTLIEI